MIWKKFLTAAPAISVLMLVFYVFNLWIGIVRHLSVHDFVMAGVLVVAGSMGIAGSDELVRCGHKKARRILWICLISWMIIPLILLGIQDLFKTILWEGALKVWFYLFLALITVDFPLALYLNRNQKKSTSQQASANES
jgi:hypothetical protein